jgi:hypothetical protein
MRAILFGCFAAFMMGDAIAQAPDCGNQKPGQCFMSKVRIAIIPCDTVRSVAAIKYGSVHRAPLESMSEFRSCVQSVPDKTKVYFDAAKAANPELAPLLSEYQEESIAHINTRWPELRISESDQNLRTLNQGDVVKKLQKKIEALEK